jgi:dTDP-4-dehydrorhamnose reductase
MSLRVAIVGSGGRLGTALAREWARLGDEIIGFRHADLDLADDAALREKLENAEFEVLLNCAALTNVDFCETHENEAYRINAHAVGVIGRICRDKGARCINISTDYVFDGEKRTPYTEEDEARPLGIYAASKLRGEQELAEVFPEHLSVRVSWVFGPDRPSFVDQILKRAQETDDLSAIADKWAVPTYTLDAATLLRPLLADVRAGGILHLCNEGGCTWQQYGQYALDCAAELGVPLKGRTVTPLAMKDLKAFIAKRPIYTVMSTAKLTELTGMKPRPWQEAVREHVRASFAH